MFVAPAHHHTWKCEGKTLGPRVAVLCVDVDTLQDDRTVFFFAANKFAAREVQSEAKRLRTRKCTK